MISTIPKVQLILDYKVYFGIEPPHDRVSLIKHISRKNILYEITALNYRLKPKNRINIDVSFETQAKELKYFTQTQEIFNKYASIAQKYTKSKVDFPIIFNRPACLFAIEEIVNSKEIVDIDDFVMAKIEVWEAIIKYLLAVNFAITQIKKENSNFKRSFESLNPKLLPLNELLIETDQIFTPFRGYWLIDHFLNHSEFSIELKNYFQKKYNLEPHHFILHLMGMYLANNNKKPEHNFYYLVKEEDEDLYKRLSIRLYSEETYKLLNIRKSPFINVGKNEYLISENSFLIEKTYSQLLNDFWFDWLKPIKDEKGKAKFNILQYKSEFGYFFENYLSKIFLKIFENYKYSTLLMFDQLKTNTAKGHIEIADIYFRNGNKILLGQVKSGGLYDAEKYGGNIEQFYKNNRDAFFENFGINQVVKSIGLMDEHIKKLDQKFPKGHSYQIYPCIIVNDKSFQTPLMPNIFNNRFKELTENFIIKKVKINPLTVIHINDLERLEDPLNKNPKYIWELLQHNHRDKRFIPPFYNSINYLYSDRQYPPRILDIFNSLELKYNT